MTDKVDKFTLITNRDKRLFINDVNDHLDLGWELYGDSHVAVDSRNADPSYVFSQSMIKHKQQVMLRHG